MWYLEKSDINCFKESLILSVVSELSQLILKRTKEATKSCTKRPGHKEEWSEGNQENSRLEKFSPQITYKKQLEIWLESPIYFEFFIKTGEIMLIFAISNETEVQKTGL